MSATALIGCPHCGALQASTAEGGGVLVCRTCRSDLERRGGRSLDAALACATATWLLLIPANLLPFLTTTIVGVSRQSRLWSSASSIWGEGWPWMSVAIGLFVIVAPLLRFGLLTWVLGALRFGWRPPRLGAAFRWTGFLAPWAMLDVFLLGLAVAYARLAGTISVDLGAGGICFVLAALTGLFTRATLDRAAVWRAMEPDAVDAFDPAAITCPGCERVTPRDRIGGACTRCGAVVYARKPQAVSRATALTLAGVLLYVPANVYAIATLPIGFQSVQYNVLEGVRDLLGAGLVGLALLVFCASFAIPLLKLVGIAICLVSVLRRSRRGLVAKTRLYGVVEEIGRWSMVDPFVIACFVPVMDYNTLIHGRAGPAAPAFTAVVIVTMIAARAFDPRLMWDASRRSPG